MTYVYFKCILEKIDNYKIHMQKFDTTPINKHAVCGFFIFIKNLRSLIINTVYRDGRIKSIHFVQL